jgi:hypothetical protein
VGAAIGLPPPGGRNRSVKGRSSTAGGGGRSTTVLHTFGELTDLFLVDAYVVCFQQKPSKQPNAIPIVITIIIIMKKKRLLVLLPQLLVLISDHCPLLTHGFLPASSLSSSSACWSLFRKRGGSRRAGQVIIDLIDPAARKSRTFSNVHSDCKLVASTEVRLSQREDDSTLGFIQQELAGPMPDPDHLLQVAVKSNDAMERHSSLSSTKSSSESVLNQSIVLPGVAGLTFLASARALLLKRRRIRSRDSVSVGTLNDSNNNEKSGTGTSRDGVSVRTTRPRYVPAQRKTTREQQHHHQEVTHSSWRFAVCLYTTECSHSWPWPDWRPFWVRRWSQTFTPFLLFLLQFHSNNNNC